MPEQRSYTMQEILNGALNQPAQTDQQQPAAARSYSMQEILNGALDHAAPPSTAQGPPSPTLLASRREASRMEFEKNRPEIEQQLGSMSWAGAFERAKELGQDLTE